MILFTGWQQPASSNFCPYESNGRSAAEETPGEESLQNRPPSQYALSMKDGVPTCGIARRPYFSGRKDAIAKVWMIESLYWLLLRNRWGKCIAWRHSKCLFELSLPVIPVFAIVL